MAHEAAHFIRAGHPSAMKDFLENIGVLQSYIHSESRIYSEVLILLNTKLRPTRFSWRCPACSHTFFSNRRLVASCGTVIPKSGTNNSELYLATLPVVF
jgi:hypothetical protein